MFGQTVKVHLFIICSILADVIVYNPCIANRLYFAIIQKVCI